MKLFNLFRLFLFANDLLLDIEFLRRLFNRGLFFLDKRLHNSRWILCNRLINLLLNGITRRGTRAFSQSGKLGLLLFEFFVHLIKLIQLVLWFFFLLFGLFLFSDHHDPLLLGFLGGGSALAFFFFTITTSTLSLVCSSCTGLCELSSLSSACSCSDSSSIS